MTRKSHLETLAIGKPANKKISSSQENLHRKFKYFGVKHLEARRKCIGLLPQIFKERIYEKKGFDSIFEYAAKLAGLSQEQVRRALNLRERFEDMPTLKNLLETGEVSINKLARVASIATPANEKVLAEEIRILSKQAVETLVKDIRNSENESPAQINNIQEGLQKPLFAQKFVPGHKLLPEHNLASPSKTAELKLSVKNLEILLELQNKGIDINNIIEKALQNREAEIAQAKNRLTKEPQQTGSRYIPAAIRKIIDQEQGDKCSAPDCHKPAQIIHHELPFTIARTHDPHNLQKLCKGHHELKHSINIKFHEMKMQAIDSG